MPLIELKACCFILDTHIDIITGSISGTFCGRLLAIELVFCAFIFAFGP